MKIFGYELKKQALEAPAEIKGAIHESIETFSLGAATDLPLIREKRNESWVSYGSDNLYPEFLKDLFNTSPTHNAIAKTKAQMVVGEGFEIDSENLDERHAITALQICGQAFASAFEMSLDFQIHGAMAIEAIWSLDGTRVVEINRIDPSKLRSGKFEDGKVREYFYKRNWADRQEDAVRIAAFDPSNKEDKRQVLYVAPQKVSNEYYGEPSYIGAMDWITLESQVGLYYKSLIENGFNPSILVKFYRKPASQEERAEVVNGLKATFGGVKKAGKAMVFFSDGKDLAPDLIPIDVQNVDKQFTVIADQITQKILTGERATTPELFGLSIPGQLGSGDFETKVKCFEKFVIAPDQRIFESAINSILAANGIPGGFKLKPMKI